MKTNYVLITGASRGIGNAIAIEFAKQGHSLVLVSKSSIQLLETLKEHLTSKYQIPCECFLTDVSDYNSVCTLKQMLDEKNIVISTIINNAGISHFGLIQDTDIALWNKVIETNLSSCFYVCKTFIDDMVRTQTGHIINISSVWGTVGASCEVAYSASKGGVNAFTKALAKELAPSGISVNAIACGAIDTEMNQRLSTEERECLENEIPAGRMGTPEEVAKLAYKIARSDVYLTGQIITIDGGWT